MKSNRKCCSHSSSLKRLSLFSGEAMGEALRPATRIIECCHSEK